MNEIDNVLILLQRYGREERAIGKDESILSGTHKAIVSITGKSGTVIGGNVILEHHNTLLHDINIELVIDGLVIFNETLEWMNTYKVKKDEQSPIYLVTYYEDATSFGSWLDYSYATFKYIVGVNPTSFRDSYYLYVHNTTAVDIVVNYLVRYTITVAGRK